MNNKSIFNISPSDFDDDDDDDDVYSSDEESDELAQAIRDSQEQDEEPEIMSYKDNSQSYRPSYVQHGTPRTSYTPPPSARQSYTPVSNPTFGRPFGGTTYTPPSPLTSRVSSPFNYNNSPGGMANYNSTYSSGYGSNPLDRSKKIIFCDLQNVLVESFNPPLPIKASWDMRLKFDVLGKLKCFTPEYIFIIGNEYFTRGSQEELELMTIANYIKVAIGSFLQMPPGHCNVFMASINGSHSEYIKPNCGLLEAALESLDPNWNETIPKSSMVYIGSMSGYANQNDRDLRTAERFGCDYLGLEELMRSY